MLLEIFRKPLNCGLDRPSGCITERTKRFAFDVVAEIQQQLRIFRTAAAFLDAIENLDQPVRAFTTRRAPTARLVFVELSQILSRFKDVDSFVHDDETAG